MTEWKNVTFGFPSEGGIERSRCEGVITSLVLNINTTTVYEVPTASRCIGIIEGKEWGDETAQNKNVP